MQKTPTFKIFQAFLLGIFIFNNATAGWIPLGNGLPARVRTVCVHNGELYAGGDFTELVKKWDGASWVSVAGGLSGTAFPKIDALISFNGDLYAGGSFTIAGSASGNIAKFDGNNWVAVGDGLGGIAGSEVKCLTEFNSALYAGGTFNQSGVFALSKVAKLNAAGNTWSQVGGGAPSKCSAGVYAMAVYYNEFYVGGQGSAPWINKLNLAGNAWVDLAPGGLTTGVGVYALAAFRYPSAASMSLFIGGDFTGQPSGTCCVYNNGTWGTSSNVFSSGVADQINAFLSTTPYLYTGGVFTCNGLHLCTNIAKRSTTIPWDSVSVNFNGSVDAFAILGGFMVAGGNFTTANGTTVNYIAINDGIFVSVNETVNHEPNPIIYPNPSCNKATFCFNEIQARSKSVSIIDVAGKIIYKNETSDPELVIEVGDFPKGIYFYRISGNDEDIKKGSFIVE